MQQPKLSCIKTLLAQSPHLTSIPSTCIFQKNHDDDDDDDDDEAVPEPKEPIPIVDFSHLLSGTPDKRSKVIAELRKACQDWGFFMVSNHGVEERLMKGMIDGCKEFFDLKEEEKQEFEGKHVMDPNRCGTSFNAPVEQVFCWRDFLKFFAHPELQPPTKPPAFRTPDVVRELPKGISESIGLEEKYMDEALRMEQGLQVFIANLYPPCPQPHLAMGLAPHSDHILLSLLTNNGIGGLQVQRNGKWITADEAPNSFLVLVGDQLEILSNGSYKSAVHRAIVNNNTTRLSIAIFYVPSLDAVVSPAPDLTDNEHNPPAYNGMQYTDYVELKQRSQLDGKSCLDHVRVVNN